MSLGAAAPCWLTPVLETGLTQDGRPPVAGGAIGGLGAAPMATGGAATEVDGTAVFLDGAAAEVDGTAGFPGGAAVVAEGAGADVLGWL